MTIWNNSKDDTISRKLEKTSLFLFSRLTIKRKIRTRSNPRTESLISGWARRVWRAIASVRAILPTFTAFNLPFREGNGGERARNVN